ncbi:helix-turn-helix transcriptional regulator [Thermoclostridium stercorarium]|nr:helix-turn-helix domain-containing protein [Thermoclostridium stercorarium]
MVTIIIPLRLGGRFIVGNAVFIINDVAYQKMFTDEISQERNMYIFSGKTVISAKRAINIPDEVILKEISETEDSIIRDIVLQDGSKYILFAQRGKLLNLCYVSVIPHETVQMQTARSRLAFSLFLLMLSVPCGLLTVYFANRHVKPIREIQKSIGGDITAEDGFSAIKKGIETLKGENKALHTRLDESMGVCRADFVKRFVKCRFPARRQAVDTASALGMDIDMAFYCISITSALPPEKRALEHLNSTLNYKSGVTGYGTEIFDHEQYLFILFANERNKLESWLDNAKAFLSSLDNEAVMAVSNIHVDFSEATNAYLEASTAYDNRFVMGDENILRFSDVSSAAKDIEPFTENYLEGFRRALYAGDAKALHDRINELFRILKTKKFSLFAFRIIYNEIVSMLLNKYLSYGDVSENSIRYYDIFELSRCRKVSDLTEILQQLCNDILRREEQNMPNENPVIGRITDYIRENYTDPGLSIGTIAEIYGMSAAALSQKYKEQTGMYPSEYLMLLRMEKAKELLSKTDMSIQEIGTSVGYYDASSFIRRFKQHMGMTPAKYRMLVKNASTK